MLSDSLFEVIETILDAVCDYDYSADYKQRIVSGLAHLYLTLWTLDRLDGEMTRDYSCAKKYAAKQFDMALKRERRY